MLFKKKNSCKRILRIVSWKGQSIEEERTPSGRIALQQQQRYKVEQRRPYEVKLKLKY